MENDLRHVARRKIMPYGMKKNGYNEWIFINRDYEHISCPVKIHANTLNRIKYLSQGDVKENAIFFYKEKQGCRDKKQYFELLDFISSEKGSIWLH